MEHILGIQLVVKILNKFLNTTGPVANCYSIEQIQNILDTGTSSSYIEEVTDV